MTSNPDDQARDSEGQQQGAKSPPKEPKEALVYLQSFAGLLPGYEVPVFHAHRVEPGDLTDWSDSELCFVLDEGRRQLDRLFDQLEQLRGRAQFLFTTSIGLLVVVFAGRMSLIHSRGDAEAAIWALAVTCICLGMLGTASVIVARKDLRAIDAVLFTTTTKPILRNLVEAYGRCVKDSTNTVATQLTMFRDAVLLVLVGTAIYGVAWLVAII